MLVVPHDFSSEQAHPNDCVLLLKQWVCSHELAQPPILLLPHSRLANLTPDTLVPLKRNALSSKALKEYRKTAKKIAEKPWNLKEGADYLQDWTSRNEDKIADQPAPCNFVRQGRHPSEATSSMTLPSGWENYAPGAPRVVEIKTAVTSAQKKQNPIRKKPAAVSGCEPSKVAAAESDSEACDVAEERTHQADVEPEPAGCAAGPGQEDPGPASKRSKLTWAEPPPDVDKERWDRVASTYKKFNKVWGKDGPPKGCSKCRQKFCAACAKRRENWIKGVEQAVRNGQ